MKTAFVAVRHFFLLTVLCIGVGYAGPGIQYWQVLHKESDYTQLRTGDKMAFVCHQCHAVSEIPIISAEQVMAFCKEGATVTCPACKITTKVVVNGKHNDPTATHEITYVNDKGKECAFVAKIVDEKKNPEEK